MLHIGAGFEMIEYGFGSRIEMSNRSGMGQMVAVHATGIIVCDDQTRRACTVVDLRRRHHESMAGQSIGRAANRPRQLKYLGVQDDPGILGTRRRLLRRSDIRPTGKPVDREFNVCCRDLHRLRLPESAAELNRKTCPWAARADQCAISLTTV
jgi:hypothetical protein